MGLASTIRMAFAGSVIALAGVLPAKAAIVLNFTIVNAFSNSFGDPIGAVVKGQIFGLEADGPAQIPTSAKVIYNSFGVDNGDFLIPSLSSGSFYMTGGVVDFIGTTAGIGLNFWNAGNAPGPTHIELGTKLGPYPAYYSVSFQDHAVFSNEISFSVASGVPEPSTWAMMMVGFAGLGYAGYRKRRMVPAAA